MTSPYTTTNPLIICQRCHIPKPPGEFYARPITAQTPTTPRRVISWCKSCARQAARDRARQTRSQRSKDLLA